MHFIVSVMVELHMSFQYVTSSLSTLYKGRQKNAMHVGVCTCKDLYDNLGKWTYNAIVCIKSAKLPLHCYISYVNTYLWD